MSYRQHVFVQVRQQDFVPHLAACPRRQDSLQAITGGKGRKEQGTTPAA